MTLLLGAGPALAQSAAQVPISGEERLSGEGAVNPPTPPGANLQIATDAVAEQRNTKRRLQRDRAEIAAERRDFKATQSAATEERQELQQDREVEACLKRARDVHEQARCAYQESKPE